VESLRRPAHDGKTVLATLAARNQSPRRAEKLQAFAGFDGRLHIDRIGELKSRHRAALLAIQRICSNTARLACHGRRPSELYASFGKRDSIVDRCRPVIITLRFRSPSPPQTEVLARKS